MTSSSNGSARAIRSRTARGLYLYRPPDPQRSTAAAWTSWADFYESLFNFRQIRFFDIEGKPTGLLSRAMTSPDGKIRIPINEDADDKSQIEEYLQDYNGEGIQHIACGSRDHLRTRREPARRRPAVHAGAARHLLRHDRRAPARPRRDRRAAAEATAS